MDARPDHDVLQFQRANSVGDGNALGNQHGRRADDERPRGVVHADDLPFQLAWLPVTRSWLSSSTVDPLTTTKSSISSVWETSFSSSVPDAPDPWNRKRTRPAGTPRNSNAPPGPVVVDRSVPFYRDSDTSEARAHRLSERVDPCLPRGSGCDRPAHGSAAGGRRWSGGGVFVSVWLGSRWRRIARPAARGRENEGADDQGNRAQSQGFMVSLLLDIACLNAV